MTFEKVGSMSLSVHVADAIVRPATKFTVAHDSLKAQMAL